MENSFVHGVENLRECFSLPFVSPTQAWRWDNFSSQHLKSHACDFLSLMEGNDSMLENVMETEGDDSNQWWL